MLGIPKSEGNVENWTDKWADEQTDRRIDRRLDELMENHDIFVQRFGGSVFCLYLCDGILKNKQLWQRFTKEPDERERISFQSLRFW